MRVSVLALGTRGDVQRLTAFALGLQLAGYTVRIAAPEKFYEFITSYGLECAPVTLDVRVASRNSVKTGRLSPSEMYRLARQYMRRALIEIWEMAKDSEALVFSDWGRVPGIHIAEKLDIPAFMGLGYPQQMLFLYRETGVFGGPCRWPRAVIRKQIQWHSIFKTMINEWRQETLGLPPVSFWQCEGAIKRREVPLFYAYSSRVFPRPSNWPSLLHVIGYCFLDRPIDWQPPTALVDFLKAGPPLGYVGFSSMTNRQIENMTGLVLKALALTKQRGLLVSGWSSLGKQEALPSDVFVTDAVPHDWLFPQVAAAVHHGGLGTLGAAIRAGIPSVVIPFVLDQPFWGWRVTELGIGPPAIPPKALTVERLATAIDIAVHDTAVRERATLLGQEVRAEDGVARAVELFQHYVDIFPTGGQE